MSARWYFRGSTISCDELGTVKVTCPQSGWYYVQNHYGAVSVHPIPWTFWRGLWASVKLRFVGGGLV